MYQTDFVCTYKQMDTAEMQEGLYRLQILQACGLTEWDDDAVEHVLYGAFHKVAPQPVFQRILQACKQSPAMQPLLDQFCPEHNTLPDLSASIRIFLQEVGASVAGASVAAGAGASVYLFTLFKLLFMYDFFDVFHACLADQLRAGQVTDRHLGALLSQLAL